VRIIYEMTLVLYAVAVTRGASVFFPVLTHISIISTDPIVIMA